jgi:hypothetical protein
MTAPLTTGPVSGGKRFQRLLGVKKSSKGGDLFPVSRAPRMLILSFQPDDVSLLVTPAPPKLAFTRFFPHARLPHGGALRGKVLYHPYSVRRLLSVLPLPRTPSPSPPRPPHHLRR